MSFRERAGLLVNEIHRDLPDYSVHDITHLDGLWDIGDIICGDEFRLTPAEAFVLGGAFLLHDAAMSLAAYPEGARSLKADRTWPDIVRVLFEAEVGRVPTSDEIQAPPEAIRNQAITLLLRNRHASEAERLPLRAWKYGHDDAPKFLIEDSEVRNAWGRTIGLISHSHWWPVSRIEEVFSRTIGPPHWCPTDWIVDPLKIACILRVADAGHLDSRRAPDFLMALRKPRGVSRDHWSFQSHLHKPHRDGDALSYTSGHAFSMPEAQAWWLCFDTLSMVDRELRDVDALLADKGLQRLAVRRVAGIESSERLAAWIPTDGWLPVDAAFHVDDVPALVRKLGGTELYGDAPEVALRELVQNASDAIRARIRLEKRPDEWGRIDVRFGRDVGGAEWLEVEDNGVGMSRGVLCRHLLEFGGSLWRSPALVEELPGLAGTRLNATGIYGIGFFSVFMLGSQVQVRTRRFDVGQSDTWVLEIDGRLSGRAILRHARREEQVRDGGTCVRVCLDDLKEDGLFRRAPSLQRLCSVLCIGSDIDIFTDENGTGNMAVRRNEWLTSSGEEFVGRLVEIQEYFEGPDRRGSVDPAFIEKIAANLEFLRTSEGECVGRACVALDRFVREEKQAGLSGVVTVGGLLACETMGIVGIVTGRPVRAARDCAIPQMSRPMVADWASRQAQIVSRIYPDVESQFDCAAIVRKCGGDTGPLPIALHKGQWLCAEEISRLERLPDEVLLPRVWDMGGRSRLSEINFGDSVFVTEVGWGSLIREGSPYSGVEWWPDLNSAEGNLYFPDRVKELGVYERYFFRTIGGLVTANLARAWGADIVTVLRRSSITHATAEKRVIGRTNGKDVLVNSYVIRKA